MSRVSLDNVGKAYGRVEAVAGVDLEVGEKEFVVLLGPSGCGKSTVLRMIAGLEDISSGEIRIGGRRVNETPAKNRNVAMVFQNYALFPHMTVRQNMSFGLRIRKTPKAELKRRVAEAAEILELTPYLDRRPARLSGGQRQRVAMGRAMVRTPEVFLFDEPLSNLDAKLRAHMRLEIKKLHKKLAVTTVYVTHDQVEAMTLASRVVIMKDGRIVQIGTPREVYDRPVDVFVAGFIGAPPMNLVPMTVVEDNGVPTLEGGGMRLPLPNGRRLEQGRKVVMGLRPGDLSPAAPGDGVPGTWKLPATVEVGELLGSEYLLNVVCGETELLSLVGSDLFSGNEDAVTLAFNLGRLHVFDAESGLALR